MAFPTPSILGQIFIPQVFLLGMTPTCQHFLPGDFTPGSSIVKKSFFINTLVLLSKSVLIFLILNQCLLVSWGVFNQIFQTVTLEPSLCCFLVAI